MSVNEDFTKLSKLTDVGRWHINEFIRRVAKQIPAGSRLLDAGAGEGAYRSFFAHCEYKAADLAVGDATWNYEHLDYVAPLDALPIPDNAFDAVLCTQVLEHLERPRASVREFYRVLRPGGTIYLTAPMAHHEHQTPYDFFRYTSFGLKSVLAEAGFTEIKIEPFGGMFTRWAYELPRAIAVFPRARNEQGELTVNALAYPFKLIALATIRAAQGGLLLLERLDKTKNDPFGWSATATKNSTSIESPNSDAS